MPSDFKNLKLLNTTCLQAPCVFQNYLSLNSQFKNKKQLGVKIYLHFFQRDSFFLKLQL